MYTIFLNRNNGKQIPIKTKCVVIFILSIHQYVIEDKSFCKILLMPIFINLFFVSGIESVINPEYVVSDKGKFMLTRHGFNFTATKRVQQQNFIRTQWRCTFKGSKTQKGCRASAISIEGDGIEKATFKGLHSHQPKNFNKSNRHRRYKNK